MLQWRIVMVGGGRSFAIAQDDGSGAKSGWLLRWRIIPLLEPSFWTSIAKWRIYFHSQNVAMKNRHGNGGRSFAIAQDDGSIEESGWRLRCRIMLLLEPSFWTSVAQWRICLHNQRVAMKNRHRNGGRSFAIAQDDGSVEESGWRLRCKVWMTAPLKNWPTDYWLLITDY